MPETLDFESDQFLQLLTDALRSGPGSPQWHDAVQRLRPDHPDADEFTLLCTVREHLESGKEYRSIRPGPRFTREVLAGIERQSAGRRTSPPIATLMAILCAMLILAVLGLLGYRLMSAGQDGAADELSRMYFGTAAQSASFDAGLPPGFRTIGQLPMSFSQGLHPQWPSAGPVSPTVGGGIVTIAPVTSAAEGAFDLEVTLHPPHLASDLIVSVFITDDPQFSADRAISPHELVWVIQGGDCKVVLPDGSVAGSTLHLKSARQPVSVRIIVDRQLAVVETNGDGLGTLKRMWAGPHGLDPDKPRYVGVRFLCRGNDKQDSCLVQSIRILKP